MDFFFCLFDVHYCFRRAFGEIKASLISRYAFDIFDVLIKTMFRICLVCVFENCFLFSKTKRKTGKSRVSKNSFQRTPKMMFSIFSKTIPNNSFQKQKSNRPFVSEKQYVKRLKVKLLVIYRSGLPQLLLFFKGEGSPSTSSILLNQ